VVRLRSLGDCVLSTPAIRLLKDARPDLEIAVVAENRFAEVFAGNPDIAQMLPPSVRALRSFRPALSLNLHGGTRAARLTLLSGACFRAGFDIFRPGWIYNTPIPTAQEILGVLRRVHTAEHMASAMFYLGAPIQDVPRARIFAPGGRSPLAPQGRYAVVHPVAAMPEKTWPFFRELDFDGLEPVFIAGPGEDLGAFSSFRTVIGAPLRELAQLIRDAEVFVGNDSGPAHIAAAFGIPALVLFGPSDSEIWAPWRTQAEVLQANPIGEIDVEAVQRALRRLRAQDRVHA
jgi:ADP-heptose:LPS heptosyltransferase